MDKGIEWMILIRCVAGSVIGILVLFAFEKEACRRIVAILATLCIYRPVYPPIDPAATRLKPSGENIVSDLASPPATTSLLLAMISYSTSRE